MQVMFFPTKGVQVDNRLQLLYCMALGWALVGIGSDWFNIKQFYVLPTHCIYVFCVDLRTNSHYFPIQH